MAKAERIGQALQLMSVLATNTDWSVFDERVLENIIDNPKRAGADFTAFLDDYGSIPLQYQISPSFEIYAHRNQTMDQGIRLGNYSFVDHRFHKGVFKTDGRPGVSSRYVHIMSFNRMLRTGRILAEIERAGYRPGNHAELIAFGARCIEEKNSYPLAAFGSKGYHIGTERVALICCDSNLERSISTYDFDAAWSEQYRFLIVKK